MNSENPCFGVLKYSSMNIGDEIQSIAAMRFLPKIDCFVHREQLNRFKCKNKPKVIMNGWYMWQVKNFPPSNDIEPLLISMHVCRKIRKRFIKPKARKYLIEHGPVGCRDMDTEKWLNENNIPAYFSGCLTLTLQRNPLIKRKDYIIAVDVPKEVEDTLRKRTQRPVYNIKRHLSPFFTQEERYKIAKIILSVYQSAHCVVTSRLHAAMPCLALETPVVLLDSNDDNLHNDGRFTGLKELCNIVKENDFLSDPNSYDIVTPPRNPSLYLALRDKLIETCSEFTGYNNENSLLEAYDFPELELIKVMNHDYDKVLKVSYWLKSNDILKLMFRRLIMRKTRNDYDQS